MRKGLLARRRVLVGPAGAAAAVFAQALRPWSCPDRYWRAGVTSRIPGGAAGGDAGAVFWAVAGAAFWAVEAVPVWCIDELFSP